MRKFAPFLKLYSEYVKNFDTAMDTITYWMDKCPRFLDVIKTIQVRSVSCTVTFWLWSWQLDNAHLISLFCRQPRYCLFHLV